MEPRFMALRETLQGEILGKQGTPNNEGNKFDSSVNLNPIMGKL